MNQDDRNQPRMNERKPWSKPSVRSVVSTRQTRGGTVVNNSNQEDFWYSIS